MKTDHHATKTTFRSTKSASKQRRDSLNTEIGQIRDLLPVSLSVKQQLSQIQVMSLAAACIQSNNHFSALVGCDYSSSLSTDMFDFPRTLPGFLLAATMDGNLLYVSENVTDYLGYSSIELLTLGGTIYDIIENKDQTSFRNILQHETTAQLPFQNSQTPISRSSSDKDHLVACRMKVSRSVCRQSSADRFKLMYIRGHFVSLPNLQGKPRREGDNSTPAMFVGLCSSQPCTQPKESTVFVTKHSANMKYFCIDENGEFHLGYMPSELTNRSWYAGIHPDDLQAAANAHLEVVHGSTSVSVSLRIQTAYGHYLPVSVLLELRRAKKSQKIFCSNRVLSDAESAKEWPLTHITPHSGKTVGTGFQSFIHMLSDTELQETDMISGESAAIERKGEKRSLDNVDDCSSMQKKKIKQFSTDLVTTASLPDILVPQLTVPISPSSSPISSHSSTNDKYPTLIKMLQSPQPQLSRTTITSATGEAILAKTQLPPISSISFDNCNVSAANYLADSNVRQCEFSSPSSAVVYSPAETETAHLAVAETNFLFVQTSVHSSEMPFAQSLECVESETTRFDCIDTKNLQYCPDPEYSNYYSESIGFEQPHLLNTLRTDNDFSQPLSCQSNVEETSTDSSSSNDAGAKQPALAVVDDLLKPESRIAGDKRLACLLNLLRAGIASGLIKGDAGNVGSKLLELKRLHQRALSRTCMSSSLTGGSE